MGARPTSYKRGGGFLDGVDATIVDYVFTDEFNGEPFKPHKIKGPDGKPTDAPHNLYCFLTVQVDGAEEPTTTTIKVGNWDDWNVSEDGKTIWDASFETVEEAEENDAKARQIASGSAFGKLMASVCEAGFPMSLLPEARNNFEAIVGARVRFVQRKDEERTKKFGQRKSKDGKSYDRKDLVVDQVYSYEGSEEQAPAAPAPAKKPAAAAKPGVKAPAKGAPKAPAFDLDAETSATLKDILAAAKGAPVKKNNLSMAVLKVRMNDKNREAIRKRIFDDAFLKLQDGWTYNQPKGTITLAEETEEEASE